MFLIPSFLFSAVKNPHIIFIELVSATLLPSASTTETCAVPPYSLVCWNALPYEFLSSSGRSRMRATIASTNALELILSAAAAAETLRVKWMSLLAERRQRRRLRSAGASRAALALAQRGSFPIARHSLALSGCRLVSSGGALAYKSARDLRARLIPRKRARICIEYARKNLCAPHTRARLLTDHYAIWFVHLRKQIFKKLLSIALDTIKLIVCHYSNACFMN